MTTLMNSLYQRFERLVEAGWFKWLMSVIILANPVALAPQVWTALTAPSVEGISLMMWVIFALIQGALLFNGIRNKDASLFFSMLISILESFSVIGIVLVRG